MLGKELPYLSPHISRRKDVSGILFDEVREIFGDSGLLVHSGDPGDGLPYFLDGTTIVFAAEIQMSGFGQARAAISGYPRIGTSRG